MSFAAGSPVSIDTRNYVTAFPPSPPTSLLNSSSSFSTRQSSMHNSRYIDAPLKSFREWKEKLDEGNGILRTSEDVSALYSSDAPIQLSSPPKTTTSSRTNSIIQTKLSGFLNSPKQDDRKRLKAAEDKKRWKDAHMNPGNYKYESILKFEGSFSLYCWYLVSSGVVR